MSILVRCPFTAAADGPAARYETPAPRPSAILDQLVCRRRAWRWVFDARPGSCAPAPGASVASPSAQLGGEAPPPVDQRVRDPRSSEARGRTSRPNPLTLNDLQNPPASCIKILLFNKFCPGPRAPEAKIPHARRVRDRLFPRPERERVAEGRVRVRAPAVA
jgi:hypothetical protein